MKHKTNKYIRVPNGIIDRTTYDSDTFVIDYAMKHNFPSSNDLAELCDEFVWVWNKNEFPYSCYRQHTRYAWGDLLRSIRNEENYGKYLNNDYEIYGAIWTNKGLLYVAKLNDKGELELI